MNKLLIFTISIERLENKNRWKMIYDYLVAIGKQMKY